MKFAVLALIGVVAAAEGETPTAGGDTTPKETPKEEPKEEPKSACPLNTSVKIYKDEKCTEDGTGEMAGVWKAWQTALDDSTKCNAVAGVDGKWSKTTCDATGVSTALFTDAACTKAAEGADGAPKSTFKWGECIAVQGGATGKWIKVAGARSLMAGTAAALALFASQF